jgi:hypothetical protein
MPKKPREHRRPRIDPEDMRTVRFSLRLHPDMFDCLSGLARRLGLNRSVCAQHILISAINSEAGYDVLDMVGRKIDHEQQPVPATRLDYLRGLNFPRQPPLPKATPPKKR